MLVRISVAAVVFLSMIASAFSQDGARAHHLIPENTNIISLSTTFVHTELDAGVFDVGVVTPSYRRSIDVMGQAGWILIGMPIGSMSASLDTPIGVIDLENDPAQGDLFVGAALGLVGSPSLSPAEFAQHKPGFRASIAGRVYLPTGDYDAGRILNLGGNRWSLQASLPISYALGDSMIDPDLTTFEIVPVVQIFGDNNDPFGPAEVVSQDMLFGLEGHITRNFGRNVWASLDAAYEFGGETRVDGVAMGDAVQAASVGATLGLTLNSSLSLRFSYNEVVYSNEPNFVGREFRAVSAFRF